MRKRRNQQRLILLKMQLGERANDITVNNEDLRYALSDNDDDSNSTSTASGL